MKCTSVLPVCTCVYHLNAPGESGVGMIPPGTGVTEGCDMPCGCWNTNLGLLQKQHELPNTESFIQNKEHFNHLGLLPSPRQQLVWDI